MFSHETETKFQPYYSDLVLYWKLEQTQILSGIKFNLPQTCLGNAIIAFHDLSTLTNTYLIEWDEVDGENVDSEEFAGLELPLSAMFCNKL